MKWLNRSRANEPGAGRPAQRAGAAPALPDTALFERRGTHAERPLDDAAVILNPDTYECFTVNGVGASLWRLLAQPRRVPELVEALVGEFDVPPEQCRREIELFLQQLLTRRLVTRRD